MSCCWLPEAPAPSRVGLVLFLRLLFCSRTNRTEPLLWGEGGAREAKEDSGVPEGWSTDFQGPRRATGETRPALESSFKKCETAFYLWWCWHTAVVQLSEPHSHRAPAVHILALERFLYRNSGVFSFFEMSYSYLG